MSDRVQRAIVTGAASGIGRATVLTLLVAGYEVDGLDVNEEGLEETRRRAAAGRFRSWVVDVADAAALGRTLDDILSDGGPLDLLVNNAGGGVAATAPETSPADWDASLALNLSAVFHACRVVIPHMEAQGGGVIVNVASVGAVVGVPRRAAYCAAKAGVVGLTRALAVDHAANGIRVNAICPGTVASEWVERMLEGVPNPDERRAAWASRQLDGRMGSPEEVAAGIAFLAGQDGRFVNGSAWVMDGGYTAV
jgi:NAD(P)-dependent dehydrogenase (short-subunit alcohol dehydrogenase family)